MLHVIRFCRHWRRLHIQVMRKNHPSIDSNNPIYRSNWVKSIRQRSFILFLSFLFLSLGGTICRTKLETVSKCFSVEYTLDSEMKLIWPPKTDPVVKLGSGTGEGQDNNIVVTKNKQDKDKPINTRELKECLAEAIMKNYHGLFRPCAHSLTLTHYAKCKISLTIFKDKKSRCKE